MSDLLKPARGRHAVEAHEAGMTYPTKGRYPLGSFPFATQPTDVRNDASKDREGLLPHARDFSHGLVDRIVSVFI